MEFEKRFTKEMEKKWQDIWEKNNIYKFSIDEKNKPVYSIDSPPPFTSGQFHMGHVLSYSFFDFIARYKRMNGYNVYYPQGWDTQGFPTEVKVEKKYPKKDRLEFIKNCKLWTKECIEIMKKQIRNLGFSPDWTYEYKTMDENYHKLVQKSLIYMFKKKDVYCANHPVYWCPKCASALSKTDTQEIEKQGILYNILFSLDNLKVEIATTRPEMLFSCVAVLFNPKDKRYSNLTSKKITTPLNKTVPLIPDLDVDMDFGTGLVMLCTFGDKQDVIWTYRHKLKTIEVFDKYGKMINSDFLNGLTVKDAKIKIAEYLEKNKKITKQKQINQIVKIHDRCKTISELILSKQWFCKIKGYEDEIKEVAKQIKWYPDFGIHYLVDWCDNLEWDWVISRQRIFGTPLPFYYCKKCNMNFSANIEELPIDPVLKDKTCPNCNEKMQGESSVCDCWVDSSITPLVISKWGEDEEFFKKTYPADLRPQGVEIVRTWAFYTIYRCFNLTKKKPFKEILLNGNVLAIDGKKMSKSLGNTISPEKLIDEYGVDSIRQWAALSGAMAKDRPFNYQDIKFAKNFLNKLWNASKLINNSIENYQEKIEHKNYLKEIDYWILYRLKETIEKVNIAFKKYEYHNVIKLIHDFFWFDFCDYYLELIKYRTYEDSIEEEKDKLSAKYTIKLVLREVLLLLSPITPHICEEIYHKIYEKDVNKSITLMEFPSTLEGISFFPNIKIFGEHLKQIISKIRKEKANQKKSLATQFDKIIIYIPEMDFDFINEKYLKIKKDLLKVSRTKEIILKKQNINEIKVELFL